MHACISREGVLACRHRLENAYRALAEQQCGGDEKRRTGSGEKKPHVMHAGKAETMLKHARKNAEHSQ
jgi:hypothetical protein